MPDRHVAGARLSALLDDELSDEVALEVTRHLSRCDACLAELEALRATREALRRLPALQAPVLALGAPGPARRGDQARQRRRWLALACAVPLAIGTGVHLAGDGAEVGPVTERLIVEPVVRTGLLPTALGGDRR